MLKLAPSSGFKATCEDETGRFFHFGLGERSQTPTLVLFGVATPAFANVGCGSVCTSGLEKEFSSICK